MNILKISNFFLWLSLLFLSAHGGWDDPPVDADPDGLGGIEYSPENNMHHLNVEENVGEIGQGFALGKLRLTEDEEREIEAFIAAGDPLKLVSINDDNGNKTWYLNATGAFDFENLQKVSFFIILGIKGIKDEKYFNVTVIDVNDNAPRVVAMQPDPIPAIPELQIDDRDIVKIIAWDDDVADNSTLKYQLQEEGGGDWFDIDEDEGQVFLLKELDYSTRTSHRLNINISDRREPFRSVTTSVTVNVQDIPNLPPEFTRTPIISYVPEEIDLDTSIGIIQARDGDYGLNWPIKYEIRNDSELDDLDLFKIDENSGEIRVKSRIDAEDERLITRGLTYSFTVVAKEVYDPIEYPDLKQNETEFPYPIELAVKDINDQKPRICVEEGQDKSSCKETETYAFEILETDTSISFGENRVLRVIDQDSTTQFNRFRADFAENTEAIIKQAFSISPEIGMGDQQFFLIVKDAEAIDYENGQWHDEDGLPLVKSFTIVFTGINDTSHTATATFNAKVKDVNDNRPIFKLPDEQTQYEFAVCENTPHGTSLFNVTPTNPEYPNSCKESIDGIEIKVIAEDKDVTPEFGQSSIIYRWSGTTRRPSIQLGSKNGSMTMSMENPSDVGFDYERFKEEIFIVEAVDFEGQDGNLATTIPIRFRILDRNDETVDLKFNNGYRGSVQENTGGTVLTGITAEDVDETGKINCTMTVNSLYFKVESSKSENNISSPNYELIEINGELDDKIGNWFELVELPGGTDRSKRFEIIVGTDMPDREGYGEKEVDRVDLTVTVTDLNSETGNQTVSQAVTITILDENDNIPEWEEGENNNFTVSILETDFGDDDTSSDYQREIHTLRVRDNDTNTMFHFKLSNEGCEFDKDICDEIRNMFEISIESSPIGSTTLRRKKGVEIDREERKYFNSDDSDILYINVTITDENPDHILIAEFQILVDDRNDNTPQINMDWTEYEIDENVATQAEIVTINATDADRPDLFGKISYLLRDGEGSNGTDKFKIDIDSGQITAIPGAYNWFDASLFRLEVRAIDYYRESSSSGSNWNTTYVHIRVIDKNDHAPEFLTDGGSVDKPFREVLESVPNVDVELGTILLIDKDDPSLGNGKYTVVVEDVQKQPPGSEDPKPSWFRVELNSTENSARQRELKIISTRDFKGFWGDYAIKLKASDGADSDPEQLSSEAVYFIRVINENLNAPEFEYPENNETSILISILNQEPNEELMDIRYNEIIPNVKAVDKDEGSGENGEVVYSLAEDSTQGCPGLFQINSTTGMITLTQKLEDSHANIRCKVIIKASDRGSQPKSNSRTMTFIPVVNINSPPEFPYLITTIQMCENSTGEESLSTEFEPATDKDIENENVYFPNDTIHYFLKGGASDLFDVVEIPEDVNRYQLTQAHIIKLILKPKDGVILDREEEQSHNVSVYATNYLNEEVGNRDPEDILNDRNSTQWAVITVVVGDKKDTPPEFSGAANGYISSGVSPTRKTDEAIGEVVAIDRDCNDPVHFTISSDFVASDTSLPNDPNLPPFMLVAKQGGAPDQEDCNQIKSEADIILRFDPQPSHKGHYEFQITANDSVGMIAKIPCRIYMVAGNNVLRFYFNNALDFLKQNQHELSDILSSAFNYKCNVDRVFNDAATRQAMVVETHFINTTNNEPIFAEYIEAQQFKPAFYKNLSNMLAEKAFVLYQIGDSDEESDSDINQIIVYVLIGGVTVLILSLLILSATCYYNNKGLHRRVRALTANTFGSQQSDLNRLGVTMDAPNTNTFAVEGSNPIWTIDSDPRRIPDFDTDSVGSGGSVLIGAEDEDYFQKSSKNPMFQGEDIVANYDSENDASERKSYYDNEPDNYNSYNNDNASNDIGDFPFTSKMTKNPLMSLGDPSMSVDVDVDEFGDEPYQFEGNTDVGLF